MLRHEHRHTERGKGAAKPREHDPGSVFVDIAVDQGGCVMTSRATTHETRPMLKRASCIIVWRIFRARILARQLKHSTT